MDIHRHVNICEYAHGYLYDKGIYKIIFEYTKLIFIGHSNFPHTSYTTLSKKDKYKYHISQNNVSACVLYYQIHIVYILHQ